MELADDGSVARIVEKPVNPPSHLAVTGLVLLSAAVCPGLPGKSIRPPEANWRSPRVNNWYLDRGLLQMKVLHRGFAWLDTGTHEALHQAASFVQTVQERQGLLVASPDEIAWRLGYIDAQALLVTAKALGASDYAMYLESLVSRGRRQGVTMFIDGISVVVPVFNSADTISELVDRIEPRSSSKEHQKFEIILVDDGSSDESWKQIVAVAESQPVDCPGPFDSQLRSAQRPAVRAAQSQVRDHRHDRRRSPASSGGDTPSAETAERGRRRIRRP